MHIEALYHYPIKSLRGISLPTATLTPRGLPHDRTFMLLRDHGPGTKHWKSGTRYENMHVSGFPQLCLFITAIVRAVPDFLPVDDAAGGGEANGPPNPADRDPEDCIRITHTDPTTSHTSHLLIPLVPSVEQLNLPRIFIRMHQSPTLAYAMPAPLSAWFSRILGFDVVLAYLGDGGNSRPRPVLGNIAPDAVGVNVERQARLEALRQQRTAKEGVGSWLGGMLTAVVPTSLRPSTDTTTTTDSAADSDPAPPDAQDAASLAEARALHPAYSLGFADCAAYLLCTSASLEDVRGRLTAPEGKALDMMRFRPNIVVSGVEGAWEEDYWGEVRIAPSSSSAGKGGGEGEDGEVQGATLQLTANCVRCTSLNVNYATGGQDGKVLKSLQKDRRVDRGMKYEPVFGRYGFLGDSGEEGVKVRVGDPVEVTKKNSEHSRMRWPGMQGAPKDEWFSV